MSRYTMRDVVEKTGIKFDPVRVKEEWETIKPLMAKAGFLNACLPKDGVDRLKYFYVENTRVESYLEGTIFEEVFKALPIKINRGTFLNLVPNQSLRFHRDPDNKIHLPINDEAGSYFYDIGKEQAYPIEANGELYRYWTSARYHSAFNASCFDRTHLVFAEYHCKDSNPNKLWGTEILVKFPKTIKFPPKISAGDSIEQSFMVTWIAEFMHEGYMFSGQAEKWDDEEFCYRKYHLEFTDPDKARGILNGNYYVVLEAMKRLGISITVSDLNERLC